MLSDEVREQAIAFEVHVPKLQLTLARLREAISAARKAGLEVQEFTRASEIRLRVIARAEISLP